MVSNDVQSAEAVATCKPLQYLASQAASATATASSLFPVPGGPTSITCLPEHSAAHTCAIVETLSSKCRPLASLAISSCRSLTSAACQLLGSFGGSIAAPTAAESSSASSVSS